MPSTSRRGRYLARPVILSIAPALALGLAACQGEPAQPDNASGNGEVARPSSNAPSTGKAAMTPRREFMLHVMQRNANQIWDWTSYTANGEGAGYASLTTEEDWMNAESDALTLVELTKVLHTEDYRIDDADWPKLVANLRAAAQESASAAEGKNFDGMLAASDKINEQCIACHLHYVPEIEGKPK